MHRMWGLAFVIACTTFSLQLARSVSHSVVQAALRNVQRGILAARTIGALAAAAGLAMLLMPVTVSHWRTAATVGIAAFSGAALRLLQALEKQFIYTGYCHADK